MFVIITIRVVLTVFLVWRLFLGPLAAEDGGGRVCGSGLCEELGGVYGPVSREEVAGVVEGFRRAVGDAS